MISHFYPLIRSSLKKHFNTDFHLLGHNMVTKALMMLLFEMSKPFDLLLIFVMDNNSLFLFVFSSAVHRYFQSLLAGCWPQFRFLKRRGAFRISLKEIVFFYKTTSTLAKPCCQVHTHTHLQDFSVGVYSFLLVVGAQALNLKRDALREEKSGPHQFLNPGISLVEATRISKSNSVGFNFVGTSV